MTKVILVEDDEDLREELVFGLRDDDLDVCGVSDSTGLYRHLLLQPADIVVLDVGLPREDGFAVARHLRSMHQMRVIGIIMLTARGEIPMRIEGLESGADIYLVKPVGIDELRAHIRSLARRLQLMPFADGSATGSSTPVRHASSDASSVSAPNWRFCLHEWKLISPSGNEIELTHLEYVFMEILTRRPGQPVKRREIVSAAFNQDPLTYDMRRLDAMVSRLRKKMHQGYSASQPIKVAHSVGFIFADPVVRE